MRVGVDDPVVAFAGRRVVDLRVVDDVVGAERPDEFDLVGAADAGHLGARRLRDLDGERTDIAGAPSMSTWSPALERATVAAAQALEREDRRVRQRRGILERHPARHRFERPLGGADVLGEGTLAEREQVSEDSIAGPELVCSGPDGLDDASDIEPETVIARRLRTP